MLDLPITQTRKINIIEVAKFNNMYKGVCRDREN